MRAMAYYTKRKIRGKKMNKTNVDINASVRNEVVEVPIGG